MAQHRRGERELGFVAIEWVAAVALLLLPMVVVVVTLPSWAERSHAATVAAREAARVLANDWPNGDPAGAVLVATEVAADHGVDAADVAVRVPSVGEAAATTCGSRCEITMPAIAVAGISVGSWQLHRDRDPPDRRLPEPVMRSRSRSADERGTITLWVLGLCIALMFLGGLSLDLWRAVAVRRELSSMADTAATAGANGVDEGALRAGTLQLDPDRAPRDRADARSRRTAARSTPPTSKSSGTASP